MIDSASLIRAWSRVRLSRHDDHANIYELLEAMYERPQTLQMVTDAVVKLEQIREGERFAAYDEHSEPYQESEQRRSVESADRLHHALRALDLINEDDSYRVPEDSLIKHLTWHDPKVRANRESLLAKDPERWHVQPYTSLRDSYFTHYAAPLLLMHCPNIENLTYSVCPMVYSPDSSQGYLEGHILERTLLRNNYSKLPDIHLQRLLRVRLLPEAGVWWDDGRCYSHMDLLGQLRLFHRLPAIESIAVDGITINSGADHIKHFPPHTSNIKSISIGHSMLPSSIIAPLIRMAKRLEEFVHSVGGRDSNRGNRYLIMARTLGKALSDQRKSLRRLDIDVDSMLYDDRIANKEYQMYVRETAEAYGEPYWHDEWFHLDDTESTGPLHVHELPDTREYNNTIGSLHDFEALTYLGIGVKLLLGPPESTTPFRLVEALPKSLEYLPIRGYTRGRVPKYDEAIAGLLAVRTTQLPNLMQIDGVDECIPGAEVEMTRNRCWLTAQETEEEGEGVEYFKLDEGDQGWLEA